MAGLDVPEGQVEALAALLSREERVRAGRFRWAQNRRRFVVAHAVLRRLLGARVGQEPGDVMLARGRGGKPALRHPGDGLCFSMSRSHEVALYALARRRQVGVDIEWLRPLPDAAPLAAYVLSPHEHGDWAAFPRDRRAVALLTAWTRKEAVLKAAGSGLRRSPASVEVGLEPSPGEAYVPGDDRAGQRWAVASVTTIAGYVAAVAGAGPRPVMGGGDAGRPG